MQVTLLIPVLNEADGLAAIMPRIDRSLFCQILVVDGQSTDGTVAYLQENGYEYFIQKRKGLRHAYHEVWEKIRGDVVITFSPDGNCIPELLPDLIKKMQSADYAMVIVSRYLQEARSQDDDWVTAFGNWLFTKTVNKLHHGHYTDVMGIYRAFKKSIVHELQLDQEKSYRPYEKLFFTRISWEPLLSVRAAKKGLKIAEIPGDEPARLGGTRKLQIIRWGLAYYSQFWMELFTRV